MTPEKIIDRFGPDADAIAQRWSRKIFRRIPAEDLRQEALIAALRHAPRHTPCDASLKSWVWHKMEFAVADSIRRELHSRSYGRHVRVQSLNEPIAKCGEPNPVFIDPLCDPWRAIEAALDVGALLATAAASDRAVLIACLGGKSRAEIARERGVTEGRISQIMIRGKLAMRRAA